MTDWNCVLKQNHETCIHQFLKFQATKKWGWFQTSQRKTISKFWTSKKIKTLLLWGWSPVFLWNFYCLFIQQKVCGPHSIAQRWHNMDILCDHDQILYRISWNNFTNFAQGTSKILQRRFCQTFGFCVKIEFSWYLSCSEPSISAQNDVFKRSSDEFETKIDQFQTRN